MRRGVEPMTPAATPVPKEGAASERPLLFAFDRALPRFLADLARSAIYADNRASEDMEARR
jgi:hypothetical protein